MANKRLHKKTWKLLSIFVALIIVLGGIYMYVHYHDRNTVTYTSKQQIQNAIKSPVTANLSPSNTSNSSTTLVAPSGDFVSDHHPNLSGSPAPNTMTSVCNTTAGASCQIFFTNNSVVKSLPSQVANSGGSVYWNWTLQSVGLTAGSWQIKAVATMGTQTQSTNDATTLVVSQ